MFNLPQHIIDQLSHLSEKEREAFCISAIESKIVKEIKPQKNSSNISNSSTQLYCDGGSRGNPGPSGAGWVVKQNGEILKDGKKFLGKGTNNQAEYQALIFGLEDLQTLGVKSIQVCLDSELIVKQIQGVYKVKNADLQPLFLKALNLLNGFDWSIQHIPREHNK